MSDVCSGIRPACRALTSLFDRAVIQLIFRIEQIQFSCVCIYMTMTSVSAWIYTVEEINSPVYRFQYICRRSDSHKIGRLILRKMRHHCIQNTIHFLMGFSHCQSSYRITVQIKLADFLRVSDTDILIDTALINSEEHLLLVDRIRKTVQSVHLCLTAGKPSCGSVYGTFHIIAVSHTGRTFIKCHGDGGCKI